MSLYNANENLIECGGNIIQLYNTKAVINYVTTGSNRVVYNIKRNPFCSGMEIQWCKDQTFPSGTITSSQVNCKQSLLQPLVDYVGYTDFMGNYGTASINDNGNYYMRVSQSNIPLPLAYLTQSQYSNVVPFTINKQCCSLQTSSVNNVSRYDALQTITGDVGSWLPFAFNSSSQIWYNSTQVIAGPNVVTNNALGGLVNSTGSIKKVSNTKGSGLNNEIFTFTFSSESLTQTPNGGLYFDMGVSQSDWAASIIFNTGTLDIGAVSNVNTIVDTENRYFKISDKTIESKVVGPGSPVFTLATGSFYNQHVYLAKVGGGAQIYYNGVLIGGINNVNTGSLNAKYLKIIQMDDTPTDIKWVGSRQIVTDIAASASLQYQTLNSVYNS